MALLVSIQLPRCVSVLAKLAAGRSEHRADSDFALATASKFRRGKKQSLEIETKSCDNIRNIEASVLAIVTAAPILNCLDFIPQPSALRIRK